MRESCKTIQEKSRITYIDYTKAICIFLMVVGHCTFNTTVYNYIYSFHMPAFFIISGMLFKSRSWLSTLLAFAIPIIFISPINWACLYYFTHLDMTNATWQDILSGVIHYRFDTRYNFFPGDWFIWTLVVLRCLFGDIKALKFMQQQKIYIPLAITTVIYMVVEPYLVDSHSTFLQYTAERAIPSLPFFCIGLYLKDKNWQPQTMPIWLIIVFGIIAIGLPSINGKCDLFYNQYGLSYLLFIINALITTSLFFYFASKLPPSKIAKTLSTGTLLIIGFNQPLIKVLSQFIPYSFHITSVVCIALCYPLIYILERYCPILLGKWRKKNHS